MGDADKTESSRDEPQSAEFTIRLFGLGALVAVGSVLVSYAVARDDQWTALELDERAFFGLGIAGPAVLMASVLPLTKRSLAMVAGGLVLAMVPIWFILDRWNISIAVTVIVIVWLIATPLIGFGMYVTRKDVDQRDANKKDVQ